jgi:hypothetical protein
MEEEISETLKKDARILARADGRMINYIEVWTTRNRAECPILNRSKDLSEYEPAVLIFFFFGTFALGFIEVLLAQPDGFRGHFDEFVFGDVLDRLLQSH